MPLTGKNTMVSVRKNEEVREGALVEVEVRKSQGMRAPRYPASCSKWCLHNTHITSTIARLCVRNLTQYQVLAIHRTCDEADLHEALSF